MRRLGRVLVAVAAVAAGVAAPARVLAEPVTPPVNDAAATIVVVGDPGEAFALRLVAELEALGFRASVVPPTGDASRASLESAARGSGAIAAIRSVASDRGVEVWIADRVTGKTVLREIVRADGGREPDDALALRAVELLRASLLEMALPGPSRGEVAPTPQLRARLGVPSLEPPRPEPVPSLRLSLAPALLFSPGGFGPTTSLVIGLAWMPSEHVGATAFAALPIARPTIRGTAGLVELTPLIGGAGVRFVLTGRGARWTPDADLGVALVSIAASGTPAPGFSSRSASGLDAAPFGAIGVGFALTRSLRLRADVMALALPQGASIRGDQQRLATWGSPIVAPSLGADVGWF